MKVPLYQHGAHSGLQFPWLLEGPYLTTFSRNKYSHIGLSRTPTSLRWVFVTGMLFVNKKEEKVTQGKTGGHVVSPAAEGRIPPAKL